MRQGVGGIELAEEHSTKSPPLFCRLLSAKMEIDDDDEDVILAIIELSNEAAIPVGGLEIFIQTSTKKKIQAQEGISSLGPGLTRSFTYEFPLTKGTWTFMVRSQTVNADLGPFDHDFTYEAKQGRVYTNSIGSGMFTDAFSADLNDFGNTEERGVIDASAIQMTSYFGENSMGGATAISVGSAEEKDDEEEEGPRTPPWESKDSLLAPVESPQPPKPEPPAQVDQQTQPTGDLLSFSKSLGDGNLQQESQPEIANTPPPLPPAPPSEEPASTLPSLPPSAPPDSTTQPETAINSPPSEPPSGPPSKPPSGPPSGPPSKSPSGPPSGPPKSKKPPRPPI